MRIEHVAMYVTDLERAKDLFVRFFGAKANEGYHNPKTDFRSYFLSFEDGARLELMTRPNLAEQEKDPLRTGFAHIAFQTGSREAVDQLTKTLEDAGYRVNSGPRVTGDGYYESSILFLEDNLIEITV